MLKDLNLECFLRQQVLRLQDKELALGQGSGFRHQPTHLAFIERGIPF